MPRIRTLKPEHKQHRKVGMLTDRQYRLWVGMVTEADDEGRLVADAAQLRALIFAYHPRVSPTHVASDLEAIAATGLIRLYRVAETLYAWFPSWREHQRLDRAHFRPSTLPSPEQHSLSMTRSLPVDDVSMTRSQGREGTGREPNYSGKGGESEGRDTMGAHAHGSNGTDPAADRPRLPETEAEVAIYAKAMGCSLDVARKRIAKLHGV